MKKQIERKMTLKKLVIAKINPNVLHNIKGGDCLPTEPGWENHPGAGADGRPSMIVCPNTVQVN